MAQLKDLIVNGVSRFIGKVYASDVVINGSTSVNDKIQSALYIVSFDSSTGTLTTKSSDYTG